MTDRTEYIAGLRQFADWLEQNPEIPVSRQRLLLALQTNPAVEAFAAEHGLTVTFDGEGNAFCSLQFGLIQYYAYGYADFKQHCADLDAKRARKWAETNGLAFVPADSKAVTA
ncbi:hypothetical protein [Streptomyces sp. NPDC054887]